MVARASYEKQRYLCVQVKTSSIFKKYCKLSWLQQIQLHTAAIRLQRVCRPPNKGHACIRLCLDHKGLSTTMLDRQNEMPALDLQAGNSTSPKPAGDGSKQTSLLQETLLNLHRAAPAWANSFTTQPCPGALRGTRGPNTITSPATQSRQTPASSICHKHPKICLADFSIENNYLKNTINRLPSSEDKEEHNVLPRQSSPRLSTSGQHLCWVSAHTCAQPPSE